MISGRSGRIRTCDPCVPNAVLYRAEPHSDKKAAYSLGFRTPQGGDFEGFDPCEGGPENADFAGQ
jgi:L-threonylcarbamoyladenylate synthase